MVLPSNSELSFSFKISSPLVQVAWIISTELRVKVKGRLNAYPTKPDNLFAVLAEFVN
jgi:hypothetical protein